MKTRNKRIELWAHLVSAHATIIALNTPLSDLEACHEHEHDGPCTIRNHDRASRAYSLRKLGEVLAEDDADDLLTDASKALADLLFAFDPKSLHVAGETPEETWERAKGVLDRLKAAGV